ncbi:chaperonin 10-like protein [Podospora didyma]|uniref:Chaperonin 10-like protein n=1 Tax=Podospora didyma TaxID=330526 RepID=A0AAE0NQE1_9PEZI|nr:chaperonin 10-like protein [Podospora didyma]
MQFPLETYALVVEAPGAAFTMTPIVIDELRPDEVLIEMKYSGFCHTDILLQQGVLPGLELPAIPGHEGAGIVRALGSDVKDKTLAVGDSVLLSFTVCGKCNSCYENRLTKCIINPQVNFQALRLSDGTTSAKLKDGRPVRSQFFGQSSFAKFSAVHEASVVKCPYPDNLAIYSPLGCGYQTGAGTILNILKPRTYESVVIFGLGSVGFAALMAAAYLDVKQIIAVDIVNQKLSLAKELGATHILNSSSLTSSIADEVKRLSGSGGVNFAVDTTGVPSVTEQMLECLTTGGTAASIGAPPAKAKVNVDVASFFYQNKNWVSVIEGDSFPPKFIPELIELHQAGRFPIDRICKVYPIEDLDQAMSDMKAGTVIKPILQFS